MVLGFDFTSWYAAVTGSVGGLLVLVAAAEKVFGWSQWLRRQREPERPEPPVVIIEGPGFTAEAETIPERRLKPRAWLTKLDAYYRILNKDATRSLTNITTGIRRRDDAREHTFPTSGVVALAPREATPVISVSIPESLFEGLTEEDHREALLFWVRCTTAPGGARWEIAVDPATGQHSSTLL